jgi:hypothetical protein
VGEAVRLALKLSPAGEGALNIEQVVDDPGVGLEVPEWSAQGHLTRLGDKHILLRQFALKTPSGTIWLFDALCHLRTSCVLARSTERSLIGIYVDH